MKIQSDLPQGCIEEEDSPFSEIPEYLSVCDILLSPQVQNSDGTEFFGSPTKIFEYMAMGKAIISSNMAQMAEILEDRKTAILVKPADIDDMKDAMIELIENKNLREEKIKDALGVELSHMIEAIEKDEDELNLKGD